jgi:N utilization substance protein B
MANRHLSRSIAIQTLFEWDFDNCNNSNEIKKILERDFKEFAPGLDNFSFVCRLVEGVIKNKEKIDKIIEKAAPEWPINQISAIDRNVLRLGLYELLFDKKNETPSKVAINEAIELAKTFGGESSGKFVNGVLGAVYREIGGEEDDNEIMEERLAGAVVYRSSAANLFFAFVHDIFGFWTLSKGRMNEKEKPEDCAKREIKEETGLDIKIEKELGTNEYIAFDPEKGKIKKIVTYFLASTVDKDLKLKDTGGLDNVRWFKLEELRDLKMYDDIQLIVAKAIKILKHIE